jgi:predicted esterase YcpF (UPF0227 family)
MSDAGVIYFHGYGSSPTSDKVGLLSQHFKEVYAFPIDIDPEKSIPYLIAQIDNVLVNTINSDEPLVMVGTSLGGWYAGLMAKFFYSPAVLINPAYSLERLKIELEIPEEIKRKYQEIGFQYPEDTKFFISEEDEVIDFTGFSPYNTTRVPNSTHRFNGPEFSQVIDYIKTIE